MIFTGVSFEFSYYTMRGRKMDDIVAPLDDVFAAGPSTTGIGDGGNEMGYVLLCSHTPFPCTSAIASQDGKGHCSSAHQRTIR